VQLLQNCKFVPGLNRVELASALNVAVAARAPRETSPAAISSRMALVEVGRCKKSKGFDLRRS
jgi:hypothetical protein